MEGGEVVKWSISFQLLDWKEIAFTAVFLFTARLWVIICYSTQNDDIIIKWLLHPVGHIGAVVSVSLKNNITFWSTKISLYICNFLIKNKEIKIRDAVFL